MASTALDESPVLKREATASDLSLKKLDEEKATKIYEKDVGSVDDESELETNVIEKAEDVAIKVS